MNGELQNQTGGRKKALLIGAVVAVLVLAAAGAGLFLYFRGRGAPPPPPVGGEPTNAPPPGGLEPTPPQEPPATPEEEAEAMQQASEKFVADYFATAPSAVQAPQVELNVEQEMTAEQKKQYNFPADQTVTYEYVAPEPESGFTAPVLVVTSAPPAPVDSDVDGLSDADEAKAGSDPKRPDTDGDGILDGDEVRYLQTDPTKSDSDGDGNPDSYPPKE